MLQSLGVTGHDRVVPAGRRDFIAAQGGRGHAPSGAYELTLGQALLLGQHGEVGLPAQNTSRCWLVGIGV